jgi:hypothetical protein
MFSIQNAGKIIDSGGFGCVFSPNIKCKNSDTEPSMKVLSKLMTGPHASEEYAIINKAKNALKSIPNYSNYFLVDDFTLCRPDKLTKDDLVDFSDNCKPLSKKGITATNINQSLNKLMMLNMPYGGINVDNFIYKYFIKSDLILLNNSLIELLVKGILPMNQRNIYHCDIKDSNVLVDVVETGIHTRLIDWGLSVIHNPNSKKIPGNLYRRPFQFNVPFSTILFNSEFTNLYSDFLTAHETPSYYQIREFMFNYVFIWNDNRGPGHLSTINSIFKKFFETNLNGIEKEKIKEHVVEYDFTYHYIIEYLSKIAFEFTRNGEFDLIRYFNDVFLKTTDVWGFLSIYLAIVDYLYNINRELQDAENELIEKIKQIFMTFLYDSPLEVPNIDLLVKELTTLNDIFKKININKTAGKRKNTKRLKQRRIRNQRKTKTNTKRSRHKYIRKYLYNI